MRKCLCKFFILHTHAHIHIFERSRAGFWRLEEEAFLRFFAGQSVCVSFGSFAVLFDNTRSLNCL